MFIKRKGSVSGVHARFAAAFSLVHVTIARAQIRGRSPIVSW